MGVKAAAIWWRWMPHYGTRRSLRKRLERTLENVFGGARGGRGGRAHILIIFV